MGAYKITTETRGKVIKMREGIARKVLKKWEETRRDLNLLPALNGERTKKSRVSFSKGGSMFSWND